MEQFLRIPHSNDIKIIVSNAACTTYIFLESVSKVEISAKDIRVRLSRHEEQTLLPNTGEEKSQQSNSDSLSYKTAYTGSTLSSYYSALETLSHSGSDTQITDRHSHFNHLKILPTVQENAVQDTVNVELHKKRHWSDSDVNLLTGQTEQQHADRNLHPVKKYLKVAGFISSFSITLITDNDANNDERRELGRLTCDNVTFTSEKNSQLFDVNFSISDIQFDNQAYSRAPYDYPVVIIGQKIKTRRKLNPLSTSIKQLMQNGQDEALLQLAIKFENCKHILPKHTVTGIKELQVKIRPLSLFLEDTYALNLREYLSKFIPGLLVVWPSPKKLVPHNLGSATVHIPEVMLWQLAMLAKPLTVRTITIEPLSLLVSLHCTAGLYIALDQSPLEFSTFERKRLITVAYRLGQSLGMHYFSGAMFGAGWVVGSLELLGSPGGFVRAMGTGLQDFVSMPYRGLVQGPWAFLIGVTNGSASLMKHVTAGTLQSITKLANSVARNLDKLTFDEEHVRRAEEYRRQRPQGLTEGLVQGLTGLGISLLGAVGGIAHHPLQSVMSERATARSLVTGVGLGLVGAIAKPLSGAAELLALTGQGLLQGAGWTSLPYPRASPIIYHMFSSNNSVLKYNWKLMHILAHTNLLYVSEATSISNNSVYSAVSLILTTEALIIFNTDQDTFIKVISLSEITSLDNSHDPTLLLFKLTPPTPPVPARDDDENIVEMDPACRARVADYVRSTVGLLQLADDGSPGPSNLSVSPLSSPKHESEEGKKEATVLTFYVNPLCRNYFLCLLSLAKQQNYNYNFPIL